MKLLYWSLILSLVCAFGYAERPGKRCADGCTTITVGRLASVDGSVMTSHTCDSHDGHTWIVVVPPKEHAQGEKCPIYVKTEHWDSIDTDKKEIVGHIPQVPRTYGYTYGFYGLMNEHQLTLGESTFDGRHELVSQNGILNCYEMTRLVIERCKTAREAIALIDELTKTYGYTDVGECLTLADTQEVWHLEIVGPGKDKEGKDLKGAVWAAIRIPDDHVGVCANSSRIMQLDLGSPDCLASSNVFQVAIDNGWWDPKSGKPFKFCYAYSPEGRTDFGCTRREWRVFDFLAPSLKLSPNANNFPFTIKPEKKVSVKRIIEIFQDTFEGTEYDMTKFMMVPASGSVFCEGDIKNWGALVVKLKEAKEPVTAFLKGKFTPSMQERLNEYGNEDDLTLTFKLSLIKELNVLLKGDSIYDKERFSGIALCEESKGLLEEKKPDTMRLNRLLLENAYPREIARSAKNIEKMVKSAYGNPFLYYDEMYLHRINGGWDKMGERPLARAYCVYVHVTQSRSWLPDPIGGIVWVGFANPATTVYAPLYCCITELPKSYTINGRFQYTRESAWWAFARVSKIAGRIWGDMRIDMGAVRDALQNESFKKQPEIEKEALALYQSDPQRAIRYLTQYTNQFCSKIVDAYWKLGDMLWVKYQDKM